MKKILFLSALFISALHASAQVGIGTASPNTSSMLEINSTTKGFLPPRMLASERAAISDPATGLLVYQTDGVPGLYYNVGTSASPNWKPVNTPTYTGFTTVSIPTSGTLNYTIPTSAIGGVILLDFNSTTSTATINLTFPTPATAGNGARVRISITRFGGGFGTVRGITPAGQFYAAYNPIVGANTPTTVSITAEFVCDGTNWYEIAQA